jgi:hypothetical protein
MSATRIFLARDQQIQMRPSCSTGSTNSTTARQPGHSRRAERDRRRSSSFQTDPEFDDLFPADGTGSRRIRYNSDGVCDPPLSFVDDFDRPGSCVLPRMAMGEGSKGALFFSELDERAVIPDAIREFVAIQWESARPRTSC